MVGAHRCVAVLDIPRGGAIFIWGQSSTLTPEFNFFLSLVTFWRSWWCYGRGTPVCLANSNFPSFELVLADGNFEKIKLFN